MNKLIVGTLILGLLVGGVIYLPGQRRPNVVLVLSDTLRRDHLGTYGYDRDTSNHIDAFAAGAMLYENAYAQAPSTRPAVASIFTSQYVSQHSVVYNGDILAAEHTTLAEVLADAGYATAGFLETGTIGRQGRSERKNGAGYSQGFHTWVFAKGVREKQGTERARVLEGFDAAVFSWIEQHRDEPFFLYLHYIDPHSPYNPLDGWAGYYDEAPDTAMPSEPLHVGQKSMSTGGEHSGSAKKHASWISRYDEEIRFIDHRFHGLIEHLETLDLIGDTLIIFISDHGEAFGEHGYLHHSNSVYSELINIPLVVRYPDTIRYRLRHLGSDRRGRTSLAVQHIDIFPTILDVAGVSRDGLALEGLSLLDRGAVRNRTDSPIVVEHLRKEWGPDRQRAVIQGRWKLVHSLDRNTYELFDLEADGRDSANRLQEAAPEILRSLKAALVSWEAGTQDGPEPAQMILDESAREELKALGYLQ